jgi:hypothetical protein
VSARKSTRRAASPPADAEASPLYALIAKLGLGLFLLVLVLAPLVGGYPSGVTYGADLPLSALRVVTLLAGLFVAAFARPLNPVFAGAFVWSAVAGTVLSFLVHSGFLSRETFLFALLPATLDWLCYGVIFTLAAHLAQTGDLKTGEETGPLWWSVGALAAGGTLAAALGALEVLTSTVPGTRAQSPFFSPNFLAGFLGLCLPVVAAWFATTGKRNEQIPLGVATALIGGALVATGSRSGLALAVGGLGLAFLLALVLRRGKLPWARIGLVVAALALLAFVFRGALVTRAATGGSQEHSGQFRSWTWKGTAAMARANPLLGTGPGTYPYLYPKYALVAKTELAHSSYWQIAAEHGYPTLGLTVLGVVAGVGTALAGLFVAFAMVALANMTQADGVKLEEETARATLLCGLVGSVLVGALRGAFDSEWSLPGNGIPFWATLGLAAGVGASLWRVGGGLPATATEGWRVVAPKFALMGVVALALLPAFRSLCAVQAREAVGARARQGQRPESFPEVWPADPQILAWSGRPDRAAEVEPSAKRYYQLGRAYETAGDLPRAITALKEATARDPNALQAWRKLAELQEQSGDRAGALASWRELATREEGPAGTVRAIPELRETHAAYAYYALAKDAAPTDRTGAATLYEKAASVVEDYSKTSELYQTMEAANAALTGADVAKRRQELRSLYENIIREWSGLAPEKAGELTARRDETLRRLDAFAPLETPGTGTSDSQVK